MNSEKVRRAIPDSPRLYYRSDKLNGSDHAPEVEDRVRCSKEEANLVASLCEDGRHRPVIDIDWPCRLVPSSTEGHFHLYVDIPLGESEYLELLTAMSKCDLVSRFYAEASRIRLASFVRTPWMKKKTEGDHERAHLERLRDRDRPQQDANATLASKVDAARPVDSSPATAKMDSTPGGS